MPRLARQGEEHLRKIELIERHFEEKKENRIEYVKVQTIKTCFETLQTQLVQ